MTLREQTAAFSEQLPNKPARSVPRALPVGTWLDEFEIGEVLAEGSVAIVYAATDDALAVPVAIAEYMPAQLAQRTEELQIAPRTLAHAGVFARGLSAFVDESRILARCDHPSLMRILRLREANATAYRVMPRYTASNLLDVRRGMTAPPDDEALRTLLDALLGALDAFHRAGGFHGKVTPSNIVLLPNGRPLLLSPGGAARAIAREQGASPIVSSEPCFAPIEQLVESASMPLGASSDLYALAGVARYWISGQLPPPACGAPGTARHETLVDTVHRLRSRWPQLRYSTDVLSALDSALSIYPAERPHSVAQMRARMDGAPAAARDDASRRPGVPPLDFAVAIDTAAGIDADSAMDAAPLDQHDGPEPVAEAAPSTARELHTLSQSDIPPSPSSTAPPSSVASSDTHAGPSNAGVSELDAAASAMDGPMMPFNFAELEAHVSAPSVTHRSLRRIATWSAALFVLLALLAVAIYSLNQHHKLDRLLDALGISRDATNIAPAPTPVATEAPASAAVTASPVTSPATVAGGAADPMPSAPSSTASSSPAAAESAHLDDRAAASSKPAAATSQTRAEPSAVVPSPSPIRQSAPAAQPQASAHNPTSPREVCGVRTEFALYRCMQSQCSQRQWTSHAQCEHLRATDSVD